MQAFPQKPVAGAGCLVGLKCCANHPLYSAILVGLGWVLKIPLELPLCRVSFPCQACGCDRHNVTFWMCGRHKGSRAPHWHCMPWDHPPHPWWIIWDLIGTLGIGFCQNWGQFGTFGGVFKACPPASLEQFIDHGFGGSHANWSCYKSGAHPTWKNMIF